LATLWEQLRAPGFVAVVLPIPVGFPGFTSQRLGHCQLGRRSGKTAKQAQSPKTSTQNHHEKQQKGTHVQNQSTLIEYYD